MPEQYPEDLDAQVSVAVETLKEARQFAARRLDELAVAASAMAGSFRASLSPENETAWVYREIQLAKAAIEDCNEAQARLALLGGMRNRRDKAV